MDSSIERTAPEDLLVHLGALQALARELVRSDQAEDLAQQTILRALENPPRREGNLRGWLAQVARNLARTGWRGEQRQARALARQESGEGAPGADELLARSEALGQLLNCLSTLDEPQRHLLLLRYFEGLTPREIAIRCDLPPGTVRSRLARGLEHLRERMKERHGREGYRGVLLAVAMIPDPAVPVPLTGALLFMSTKLKFAAVAALLIGVTVSIITSEVLEGPEDEAEKGGGAQPLTSSGSGAELDAGAAIAVAPSTADRSPRAEVRAAARANPDAPAPPARVRGRCVAAETGDPLADCGVTLRGWPGGDQTEVVDWEDPDPVVTGSDGTFELSFPAPPLYQHALDIEVEGRSPRNARWSGFEPGQTTELGDIPLSKGYEVSGWVQDTDGRPLSRAVLSVRALGLSIGNRSEGTSLRGGSDADGSFAIRASIPPGTWPIAIEARGWELVSPASVTVMEGLGSDPLWVTVARASARDPRTITGICVDEQGLPVDRVRVKTRQRGLSGTPSAWTGTDGTFAIETGDEDPYPVQLQARDGGCEPLDDERFFEWGTTDVRLALRRGLSFELLVVEDDSGKPVEDFAVSCYCVSTKAATDERARLDGNHPGGRVTVDNVWPGRNHLVVLPVSGELAVSKTLELEALAGVVSPVTVRLAQMVPATVEVVTASGVPVSGSLVEVLRPGSFPFGVDTHVLRRRSNTMFSSSRPEWVLPSFLSSDRTDADGTAELLIPADGEPLGLRIAGEHRPWVSRDVCFPAGGDPLRVTVEVGGTLRGRIEIPFPTPGSPVLRLEHGRRQAIQREVPVAQDGSFEAPGVRPGNYRVHLGFKVRVQGEGFSVGSPCRLGPTLAELTIREGEVVELELDATRFTPGSLRGQAVLDDEPLTDARVCLVADGDDLEGWFGQYRIDSRGDLEVAGVLPGRYRAKLFLGNPEGILSENEFVMAPNGSANETLRFVRKTLRIRLLTADGTAPIANRACSLRWTLGRRDVTTDDEGWCVLRPAPAEPVTVAGLGAESQDLGPVSVPAGQREASFELRLIPR